MGRIKVPNISLISYVPGTGGGRGEAGGGGGGSRGGGSRGGGGGQLGGGRGEGGGGSRGGGGRGGGGGQLGGGGRGGGGGQLGGGGGDVSTKTVNIKQANAYKQKIEFFYQPDDLIVDKAIGVLLPLNKSVARTALTGNPSNPINAGSLYKDQIGGGGVFRLSYTTEEQAISNLKMLLLTRMGERLYHPTFGTRLQQLVFEPNTDILVEEVANALESAINFWLPYINIIDIIVDNTDTNGNIQHSIEIKLRFQVNDQGANHEIILIVTGDSVNIIQ